MIANERQYHVTRDVIARLEQDLADLETSSAGLPPLIQAAQRAGVQDQLRGLRAELAANDRPQRRD